jgi:peptidoglycan/LPS O-acetylase OafA/YrhL
MVFFHHVCFTSIDPVGWPSPVLLLRNLSAAGSDGVDLFFVLSGFLITSLLMGARRERSYYRDFYWKRALRILPLYVVCLLGVLFFLPGSGAYVLLSALFISNFAHLFHVASDGPFWTLAIEEQFYLVWPTVVRRRSTAQLRRWAIAIGASAFLLRLVAACFGHYDYYFTFLHCDGLALGAFLACWYLQRDAVSATLRRENRLIAICMILGAGLVAIPAPLHPRAFAFFAAFHQTGITIVCGSVVAFLIANSGKRSLAFLRSPLLTFFGLISYAMYMVHLYVMRAYDHFHGALMPGDLSAYTVRFFVVLGITIAACLFSRYLIELPAISLRRFVLSKPAETDPGLNG